MLLSLSVSQQLRNTSLTLNFLFWYRFVCKTWEGRQHKHCMNSSALQWMHLWLAIHSTSSISRWWSVLPSVLEFLKRIWNWMLNDTVGVYPKVGKLTGRNAKILDLIYLHQKQNSLNSEIYLEFFEPNGESCQRRTRTWKTVFVSLQACGGFMKSIGCGSMVQAVLKNLRWKTRATDWLRLRNFIEHSGWARYAPACTPRQSNIH